MTTMTHRARSILSVIALTVICWGAVQAVAHDGPHVPDMLAEVSRAAATGQVVELSVTLTGLGGPLVLVGIAAEGAISPAFDPIYVNFAEDVELHTRLRFDGPPPDIFTLMLDFGPVGQGAVVVIPGPDRAGK
ncbi:hypothetical protein [uncultured Tateyamaria sp.]|uniref:hypothetical protein n=1 Tax=uncultured Tateyamaria sp. TaxID=455651 RepID=UPI0026100CC5|nr:hypothetical protein [uncultured Tateyamaria sp.]